MFGRVNGWRRFERASHDGGGRFWAIRVNGRDCELRFGAVGGAEISEERLEHASEAEAARAAKQKIRTKQRAGWVEVEQVDDARLRALAQGQLFEQAIAADPANLDNWSVYADWLQSVEPLLGERVALGLALARVGSKDARAQLERTHARELFGVTLAGVLNTDKFEGVIELERQLGMIVGARLRDPENEIIKFDTLVSALLDAPLARVLLDLRIESGFRRRSYVQSIELFVARQHPHLRRLALGIEPLHGGVVDMRVPDIAAVLDSAPRLERAELHGAFHGEATHETLRELKIYRPANLLALALPRWRLPALQTLHVIEPGVVDWHAVELPQLKQLLIEWQDCGDRLVARLASAPVVDQLDMLTLSQTRLTAEGVRTLLDNAERFGRIRQIVLLDVVTDRAHILRLHRQFSRLVVRTDEDRISYGSGRRERDGFMRF
jgi:predicted DNA-binding WGR domain protein